MSYIKSTIVALFTLVVMSCSNTLSSTAPGQAGSEHVYVISEHIAKRLMFSAMKSEVNEKDIATLSSPELGYKSSIQWGVDQDTISLFAKTMKGEQNGKKVEGYVFYAKHSGTAPAAGESTIERLIAHVVKDAEALGQKATLVK